MDNVLGTMGPVLELVQLNMSTSEPEDITEGKHMKFMGDAKGRTGTTMESHAAVQWDLD